VNQNIPPSQPGQSENGDSDPQRDPNAGGGRENPYYANQRATAAPDLDANAPQLQSNDMQRLNRKALLFLGGIVALLAVAAFLMFRSATSKEDDVSKQPRAATVNVPDLPETQATLPAETEQAQPIEVTDYSQQEIPPLPPQPLPPPSYGNPYGPQEPAGPRQPTLMERRMSNSADGSAQTAESATGSQTNQRDAYMQAMLSQMPGNQAAANNQPAKEQATSAKFINNPNGLMVRGTYIRCVLETRIITDIPGFTSCVVTEPIYSINGRSLLLPKGSKISGRYNNSGAGDIARVSVIWDRITTPNGIDVNMASPGVDNLGGAGHPGDYNAHWGSRITSALLISIISDAFSYAAAENGPRTTTISNGNVIDTPFESSTARTMERLANQALDRSINRPPTVTINQGAVVNVYVSKDVDFTGVLARN
jgi:type IV secretion system protein VirB10